MMFTTAYRIPYAAMPGLLGAAVPVRRFFKKPTCLFWTYMDEHVVWERDYNGNDLAVDMMLTYLNQEHHIDLLHSVLNNIAESLNARRDAEHLFFDNDQKEECLESMCGLEVDQAKWEHFCVRYCQDIEIDKRCVKERREVLDFVIECLRQVDQTHGILLITG